MVKPISTNINKSVEMKGCFWFSILGYGSLILLVIYGVILQQINFCVFY